MMFPLFRPHTPVVMGLLSLAACASATTQDPPEGPTNAPVPLEAQGPHHDGAESSVLALAPIADHVLLVSVDGLRPDAITEERTPTLYRLATEGSRTFAAETVYPSTTLPAHVSMLTGMLPEGHGVTWNLDLVALDGYAPFPTVFSVAEEAGLNTAVFVGKTKLRYLWAPGSVDRLSVPEAPMGTEFGEETVAKAMDHLEAHRPNLVFVHFGDPDFAGHQSGWMSERYERAVRSVDDHLARLLEAADRSFGPGAYTVLVTADHGGHSHNHGSTASDDVSIPWILWGRGVAPGVLQDGVRTVDTTPTILRILGLAPASPMAGAPVREAFRGQ